MKRSTKVILVFLGMLVVLGIVMLFNPSQNVDNPTPTSPPNTTAPSAAPTEEAEPTAESTTEPTKEPAATENPTPTEEPVHKHTWVKKEEPATCTYGGKTWEECECGEIQNEQFGTELTHGELVYTVTVEPTEKTEGEYTETCTVCGKVINKGSIPKLEPTPAPTAAPTAAPTPTPSPKPTATPVPTEVPEEQCNHPVWTVSYVDENDTETIYQESCEDCGEVLGTFAIPKATATPTPKPTATPVPTKKPEPTKAPAPTASDVVKDYIDERGNHTIQYADGTEIIEWKDYKGTLPKNAEVIFNKSTYKTVYSTRNDGSVVEDSQIICKELLFYFEKEMYWTKEKLSYYMYYYYDWETEEYTCRLVNSDGSYNKHSDLVIEGFHSGISMQGKEVWEGNKKIGHEVTFIDFQSGYDDPRIIYAEDFIYHKNGEIRLYEY